MAPDSDPDLRARVEQLEATVEQQQATIQQLLPSRRRVLQAGGLVAGGGVLGALTADRASADVTGQVGTQQDRVDVFAGALDANSVKTDDTNTGILRSPQTSVSISSGAISADTTFLRVTAGDGTNLTTINNPKEGMKVWIVASNSITVESGTDNILLDGGSNFSMSAGNTLELFYDNTNWLEVGRRA